MERYKICPACGTKNSPSKIECAACEADITGVPVVTEEMLSQAAETPPSQEKQLVRICECGAVNPAQARKCLSCGEDISDIPPEPVTWQQEAPRPAEDGPMLVSLDGSFAFALCDQPLLLGRGHDLTEYLSSFPYVSRTQAKLEKKEGKWILTSVSHSNATFVNQRAIGLDQSVELHDGDEIGLGGCLLRGERQDGAAYLLIHVPDAP